MLTYGIEINKIVCIRTNEHKKELQDQGVSNMAKFTEINSKIGFIKGLNKEYLWLNFMNLILFNLKIDVWLKRNRISTSN